MTTSHSLVALSHVTLLVIAAVMLECTSRHDLEIALLVSGAAHPVKGILRPVALACAKKSTNVGFGRSYAVSMNTSLVTASCSKGVSIMTAKSKVSAKHPIAIAIAIVIVMVPAGYTYTIVTRCQASTFSLIKWLAIEMGSCEAASVPSKDSQPRIPQPSDPEPMKVTRDQMPCRWAWVFLGKFSHSKGEYLLAPAFRFATPRGPTSPFPKIGDSLVLTANKTLLVTDYGTALPDNRCDRILEPPWGYQPKTARRYEAGQLASNTEVTVNAVTLMPNASAEPTYVWALIGPTQ